MSGPHWHKFVSRRNLTQLGGTIRQVLASNSNDETIRVHGWVKSVRVQKEDRVRHDSRLVRLRRGLQESFSDTDNRCKGCQYCSPCYILKYRQ